EMIERALCDAPLESAPVRTEAAFGILEHEEMHQETLLYMFHNLPYEKKTRQPALGLHVHQPAPLAPLQRGAGLGLRGQLIPIPAGTATLGADRDVFGWDNELPQHRVE